MDQHPGDVFGPGPSVTDNSIVRNDGTSGHVVQGSGVVIDDSDNVTGVTSLQIDVSATINGSTVWHAGNDGSGSGLDADLVRGVTPGATGLAILADTTAAAVRTEIEAQQQADVLDDLATLGTVGADGEILVGTGAGAFAWESGATARASLGLGTIATQAASNVAITGGSISGITDLAVADGGTGASTASAARGNLDAVGGRSSLTQNYIPRADSSGDAVNSALSDDGTTVQSSNNFRIHNNQPQFQIKEDDQSVGQKSWGFVASGGTMSFQTASDDYSSTYYAYRVFRSSTNPTQHSWYISTSAVLDLTSSGLNLGTGGHSVAGSTVIDSSRLHQARAYTVATVPSAASNAGKIIRVTDETGGDTLAHSNGTNWVRTSDLATVS